MVGFRQILRKVTLKPLASVRKVPPISVSMEAILDAFGFSLQEAEWGANEASLRQYPAGRELQNRFFQNRTCSSG